MNSFISLLLAFLAIIPSAFAGSPIGIWTTENGEANFEIYEDAGKLFGKIIYLKEPNYDGKPKIDYNNPDPSKRNDPIIGLVFLKGFVPAAGTPGRWEKGTVYDPHNGKAYSSFLQLKDDNTITVRGFIGISLIGRSQIWTRIK